MFQNKELMSEMLRSPLDIQQKALEELYSRCDGSNYIADANSPFCNLLEFGSSISAACMQEIDNTVIPSIYASRATTFRELSRHISDFDYVDIFSTPANTQLIFSTDLVTLYDQAIDFNSTYKKAVIPRDTVFTVGSYDFGIYYPIEIQINKLNNNILVLHDVTNEHPLHKLTTNILEHKINTVNGLPFITFSLPVYQFSKSYVSDDTPSATGFSKVYNYNNKFYACRVYTYKPAAGKWIEMAQTTSDTIYDTGTLTAKLNIEPDMNRFSVVVPQVYFSNGLMGTKILVEVYTTQGKLDVDISYLPSTAFSISIPNTARDVTEYSNIFKKNPSTQLLPHAVKIVGGSDGITFEEAKTRVINTISHRTLLITPDDITKYFEDQSFKVTKHLDNISNRIYFCNGSLTDSDGSYIPVTNCTTKITKDIVSSSSDIKTNLSTSVTILPTAIFRYSKNENSANILDDAAKKALLNLGKETYVNELNTNVYTKIPFHVSVNLPPAKYATAVSYNLFSTEVKSIQFKYDNVDIMSQIAAYAANIIHNDNGAGGYTIRLAVKKSDDLKEVAEDDLLVVAAVKDSLNTWCGRLVEYVGSDSEYDIYDLKLETDYRLEDNYINFTNLDLYGTNIHHMVSLEADWNIVYCIKKDLVPTARNDSNIMMGLTDTIENAYIGMGRQVLTLHLGHSLDSMIYNICDASWSAQVYKRYEYDEYLTYTEDVYETNPDGTLVTTIVDDKVVLNLLHKAGDVVIDDAGNQSILHAIGDVVYDPNGNPIVKTDRSYEYLINLMHIDARMYASEDPVHEKFTTTLPDILESYFAVITTAKGKILEETKLYYRPIRTIGTANFAIGDGVNIIQNLDISFKMKLHVPAYVKNSIEYKELIESSVVKITESYLTKKKISMTEIAAAIKDKLESYIDSVDVLGINGVEELQTIQVVDDDAITSVARVLKILQDGTLSLQKDIDVEFTSTTQTLSV